jgi:hypothetical protein
VTLRELLGGALQRVVGRLGGDESPDALEDADALLDLFEQLETNVPFDVQTTFWQRWTAAGAAQRARLEPLRRRLGFEG